MTAHALIFSSRSYPWERNSGAHRIATFLRSNGMDIEVVDFAAWWDLELLKEFTRKSVTKNTIFFGFSIFFCYWNDVMRNFTSWLKKEYPHIKTVSGGQNVLHADATNIDIWIDSYGEEAMLALAKSLANNSTSGVKFSLEYFGDRKVIKALDAYPSYNLGDFSIIMQKRDFLEPWEWLTVEFARGCKFNCAFCNFPILGLKEDTSRSADNFEAEMKYNYNNFGINRYFTADETFNDRVEKITKFANVVEKLSFNPFFSGFIRADLLSQPNMIEELARMNYGGHYYGIETFNHQSGKVIGKGLHPEKVKQLLLDCKKYFATNNLMYRGMISLIVGLPFDTHKNWEETTDWLLTNWRSEAIMIFPLVVEDLITENPQNYTKLSKFSQNLTKYGLRPMGQREQVMHEHGHAHYNWQDALFTRHETLWEHDTMNVYEAKEIAHRVQAYTSDTFKIGNWSLNWPELNAGRKIQNLAEHINVSAPNIFPSRQSPAVINIINNYVLKKLNSK